MAIENIPINSGTGPKVAIDLVGTDSYQIVKVVQAGDGSAGTLSNVFTVTQAGTDTVSISGTPTIQGSVSIANTPTVTVNAMPVISASNVTIASIATGTVSVVAAPAVSGSVSVINTPVVTATVTSMPVLSASNVTIASVAAISPFQAGGSAIASGTGTGPLIMGIQSGATFARPILVSTTGGLVIDSMPAVGGGQQYSAGSTNMGATATGMVLIGVQSGATTGRALLVSTTGGLIVDAYTISNIGTVSTILGTVAVSGGGGGVQYSVGDTSMNATGTGTLALAMQSGATTARAIAITTTGAQYTVFAGTQAVTAANITVASITTGTVSVINTPVVTATVSVMPVVTVTASANPLIVSTVSTILTMPVLSATGVTVASVTTGTVNVVNVLSATGVLLGATTANVGAVVGTAHASRWDAYVVNTTSGASAILKTSGAHTLYVTDLLISVDVPMMVTLMSAATTKLAVYLATKGGLVVGFSTPMVLNSAQSLTIQGAASGSCMGYAAGYTVT